VRPWWWQSVGTQCRCIALQSAGVPALQTRQGQLLTSLATRVAAAAAFGTSYETERSN
jgi:hypothetical protein